jgi:hypothetical protein
VTHGRPRKRDVDRHLREALVDDLPPDVQGRLRTALRPSWRTATATASPDERVGQGRGVQAPGSWSPQRALLAAAALVALAVGGVVHLEAGAGPLAESFLAQQTAARVVSQLHRVSAMSGRLETRDAQGRAQRFAIEWRDTGETKVRIEGPETTQHRTAHLPREAASLLARTRARPRQEMSRPDDPALYPAEAHLTPERLVGLLAGQWERVQGPTDARTGEATFSVSTPGRPDAVRVTIDTETYLPVSLEQSLSGPESPGPARVSGTRARFVWTLTPTPPRLLNGRDRPAAASGRPEWS